MTRSVGSARPPEAARSPAAFDASPETSSSAGSKACSVRLANRRALRPKEAEEALGAGESNTMPERIPEVAPRKKIPRKAPQHAPREAPAGFEPRQTCPEKLRPRWERRAAVAHAQPMKAIELKCLECCCWSRPEAARCRIPGCPLWALNRRIFGGS